MQKSFKQYSNEVDLLNEAYHHHKRVLFEAENGIRNYDSEKVKAAHKIVNHVDGVINDLQGKYKLIIENEIISNKKGSKWYTEFFSTPSYYRTRKVAYKMFIENIEK